MRGDRPFLVRVGPVLLTIFLDLLGFGLVIPLLNFYAEDLGATALQVTWLMAAYSGAQFLGAPVWGVLSDRVGRRPVLLISVAACALFLAGFAATSSDIGLAVFGNLDSVLPTSLPGVVFGLFLFRTLQGFAAANIGTAQAYIADVTSGEERAKGMGLVGAAFGLGFALGPWVGGELGGSFGYAAPIWFAAVLSALNFFWILLALPESRTEEERVTSKSRSRVTSMFSGLTHPVVGLTIALVFISGFSFAMLESVFGLVADHVWGLGPKGVGRLFLMFGVVGIVVQGGLIGPLTRRFGEVRLVLVGFALMSVTMLGLAWTTPGLAFYVILVLMAAGTSLSRPALNTLLSRASREDEQGFVLGASNSFSSLARAVGPAVAGGVYARFYPTAVFEVGAVAMGLSLLCVIPATKRAAERVRAIEAEERREA